MNEIPTDLVPNTFPSLFYGYTVVWVILAIYIFSLVAKIRKLEKKIDTKP